MNKKLIFSVLGLIVTALILAVLFMPQRGTTPGTQNTTTADTTQKTETQSEPTSNGVMSDDTAAVTVGIDNFAFVAKTVNVKVGDTVTWTNKDSVGHTVTADVLSASAPDSGTFGKDETYSFTFTKAGTYDYYCKPHPQMTGTVVVTE